jgi:hypothetical protein
MEHRASDGGQDVKLANLAWHRPENLANRLGVESRATGGDALQRRAHGPLGTFIERILTEY